MKMATWKPQQVYFGGQMETSVTTTDLCGMYNHWWATRSPGFHRQVVSMQLDGVTWTIYYRCDLDGGLYTPPAELYHKICAAFPGDEFPRYADYIEKTGDRS